MPDPTRAGMNAGDFVIDTLLSIFPNVLNQLNRVGGTDVPVFDPHLGYPEVFQNAGYSPAVSAALGLGTGFLEPGPAEFRALGDLAPLLGAIPLNPHLFRDVRRTQFLNPADLAGAQGNSLRRSPNEMREFAARIEQEGFQEPAILLYDPRTGRYKVGEGNHRVAVAQELGEPIPVEATRGQVLEYEGQPLPRQLVPDKYGYVPSNLAPSDLGLPSLDRDALLEIAQELDMPPERMAVLEAALEQMQPPSVRAVPPTPAGPSMTLQRIADDMLLDIPGLRQQLSNLPPDRAVNLLVAQGLPEVEARRFLGLPE